MAERLKTKLLESDKLVDVVAGPDAYRDLPRLLRQVCVCGGGRRSRMHSFFFHHLTEFWLVLCDFVCVCIGQPLVSFASSG
jgi:hypothetical protein